MENATLLSSCVKSNIPITAVIAGRLRDQIGRTVFGALPMERAIMYEHVSSCVEILRALQHCSVPVKVRAMNLRALLVNSPDHQGAYSIDLEKAA